MKKILSIVALSTLVSTSAFAGEAGTVYAGANVGTYGHNISDFGSATGLGVDVGYNISKNLAVEFGYDMIGQATGTGTSKDAKATFKSMQLTAKGTMDLNDTFGLYGKLGYASNGLDYKSADGKTSLSWSNGDLTYGVGAEYNLSKSMSINVEYSSLGVVAKKDANVTKDVTLDKLSVGMNVSF